MKRFFKTAFATTALTLVMVGVVLSVQPHRSVSADGTPTPVPTRRVRPTQTPNVVVVTATPTTVASVTTIACEYPYDTAPYGQPYPYVNYANPLQTYNPYLVPAYGGNYGWTVPMLVTRVNGVITQALPNTSVCSQPAAVVVSQPAATATPDIAAQIASALKAVAPAVVAPPLPQSFSISPPRTGSAGLHVD